MTTVLPRALWPWISFRNTGVNFAELHTDEYWLRDMISTYGPIFLKGAWVPEYDCDNA